MKHYFITLRLRSLCLLTAAALAAGQIAWPPLAEGSHLGSSTASAGSAPPPGVSSIQSFQPDLFTGRAATSIPIAVPPGRKGMQPALALAYSSSGRNGWIGVGWSLELGSIERSTRNGPPAYAGTDTYTFSFQGVQSDLVQIVDGTYRAKDEGLFLRFQNNGAGGWEVRDKSGTRYLFGVSSAARQASGSGIFRWCLEKILDTNGNALTATYVSDQGQSYLSRIDYTSHETGGSQDLSPANRVDFITESRSDVDVSYRSGSPVATAKRLKEIAAYAQGQLARKYVLTYAASGRTGRSLLASVRQTGADGVASLPAATFAYQDAAGSTYSLKSNSASSSTAAWNVRKANFDAGHENYGCQHPYGGLPWGASTSTSGSVDLGCVSASVSSSGSISGSGCPDHYLHAWVYVYMSSAQTLNLPVTGSEADACLWREDAGGVAKMTSAGVPLAAGWSILHLTAYNQHAGWSVQMGSPLKSLVTAMSPSQFVEPELAGDADGNGISDLITFEASNGTWSVSCARMCAMGPSGTWLTGFGGASSIPLVGDWNGDGRVDIGIFSGGSWQFATSTGTSFQAGTVSPLTLGGGTPLTGDFNGDGRTDIGTFNSGSWHIGLSTGSGFVENFNYAFDFGNNFYDPLTGDLNGDGFTDLAIVDKSSGTVFFRRSTGNGAVPEAAAITNFGPGQPHASADFNGDGLSDIAYYDKSSGQVRVAHALGAAFGAPVTLPVTFSLRSADDAMQVGDFNGDGLADPAVFNAVTGNAELSYSNGTFPDLLSAMSNGVGGSTTFSYEPSTMFDNTGSEDELEDLPFVLPIVTRIDLSDGMGNAYATTFTYEGGRYDAAAKEFRGFRHVDARDAVGLVTHHWFLQDADTKGRSEKQFTSDPAGNRYHEIQNEYVVSNPYPGVTFTALQHRDLLEYNGDSIYRQSHTWFYYDQYGNVVNKVELGEDPQTGDERQTTYVYAVNEPAWILNALNEIHVHEGTHGTNSPIVSRRWFYYDGATDINTPPTKGNLTKEREWLVSDPKNPVSPKYLDTKMTYDAYGNVKTVTDALNRVTTNDYDTATATYLVKITNALGHTRELTYDPRFGQVTSSKDQNGVVTTTDHDALGRIAKVIGPTDTAALPTVEYAYDLSSVPTKTVTHARITSGSPLRLTLYAFHDGLGRLVQTRSPAEDPTKQVVTGAVAFDARGLVVKAWAPYLEAFSSAYVPVSSPAPRPAPLAPPVQYTYDLAGRLLTTTDPDGSVSAVSYDDWSVTVTDANGHSTRRTSDAYGRLATVEEFVNGQTLTTTYAYDVLDQLMQVTDAAGNVTRITYDSLGRKIRMDDPDMGVWTYTYDDVDNLKTQTDARGAVIAFAYDALNRLTQKSYTVPPASSIQLPASVVYSYDDAAKPFSKGRLTGITDGSGSSSFEYDNLGRLTKESKTIDGVTYTVQRSYDLLGRVTSLTYPDNEVANYTYNAQGGIEAISLQQSAVSQSIVTDIDYNAAGQVTRMAYGNGVTTDYAYDPQTLRLQGLVSKTAGSSILQDFSYAFDGVGNVTQITDRVRSATQTFGYDDLSRLASASGSYGNVTYQYDAIGNLTQKEGVAMSYGVAGGAKPHAVTSLSSGIDLAYDATGNLLTKVDRATGTTQAAHTYDAEGRLASVTAGGSTTSFTYDGDGGRVKLTNAQGTAKFLGQLYEVAPPLPLPTLTVATLEAEAMPTKTAGSAIPGGWNLSTNGYVEAPVSFPTSGAYDFQVVAKGSVLNKVWPNLEVRIDQQKIGNVAVNSTSWKTYTLRGTVTAGSHRVALAYTNDAYKNVSQDRNLYLDKCTVIRVATTLTVTTKALFAGGQRLATKDSIGAIRFFHTDHLGSTNLVTDQTGMVVEVAEYKPYGEVINRSGPVNVPYKFTGQRQDATSGQILFPARAYDPSVGQFCQADALVGDPATPQFLNRYSYVRGNPINRTDPTGHCELLCQLIVFAISVGIGTGLHHVVFNNDVDPAVLQDTGVRFLQLMTPPSLSSPHQLSQVGLTMAHASADALFDAQQFSDAATLLRIGSTPEKILALSAMGIYTVDVGLNLASFGTKGPIAGALKSGGREVATRGLARSAVVSPARAEELLRKYGASPKQARNFVTSFEGPITARIVETGEKFGRFTGDAESKGHFLTKSAFASPAEAKQALGLQKFSNPATLHQEVAAGSRTVVLEGGIKGGRKGVRQSLIVDHSKFNFGKGEGF
jgi:RHS repeat-associated protein